MSHSRAFTLIELLLVISLIAILSMISLPGITHLWQKSRANSLSAQLFNAIDLARSEAIVRQEPVFLLPVADHWQNGFILKTTTQIIRTFSAVTWEGQLYWRSFPLNQQALEFLPDGLLNMQNGTFWFCLPKMPESVWLVVVNKSGRARMDWEKKLTCGEN